MGETDPDQALRRLLEGNASFQEQVKLEAPWASDPKRGQQPYAVVLGCADSRVAPELVFDKSLGEIFVVRVAGNVANTASIASVEFAVENLGVRLVVVLGHESCGAVSAALADVEAGRNLDRLLEYVTPAVEAAGTKEVDGVARCNARLNAERLITESEILHRAAERDGLRVVPAFFHFDDGAVELL